MGELAVIPRAALPASSGVHKGPGWRRAFLRHLRQHGYVSHACDAAGISVTMAYKARERSSRFAEAWKWADLEARERKREEMEAELVRRALEGWTEPVYQRGRLVGHRTRHSDRLLIFWLEANHPRYRKAAQRRDAASSPSRPAIPPPPSHVLNDPEYRRLMAELDACVSLK